MAVNLPLYTFLTIQADTLTSSTLGLPYSLLLMQFLQSIIVPEGIDEIKGSPLSLICRVTLSHSIAQLRWQQGQSIASK